MFELRTTLHVQEHRNEYLDLAPYFRELFPDPSIFFEIPFKYFRNSDGSMFALPFIFSPKVMFYNKETLKKANCPPPSPKWEWKDFIHSIKILKKIIPPGFILNYCSAPHFWMNFVFLNGGALLEPDAEDPVRIDSPETIAGIQAVRELYEILGGHELPISYPDSFLSGETPFLLSERETLCYLKHHNFDNWGIVPLPAMPGGRKMVAQATDLICIRKECVDSERIFRFLSFMLSENVQDFIAREKYGIPIRKTSAWKTIDQADPRDVLFLIEMNHMTAEYNLDSPELMTLVQNGISQIIRDRTKPLHESLEKLADAVRTLLEIKKCTNEIRIGA